MIQSPKTFRVFVSSTFSDLVKEREALQDKVFAELRELCAQNGAHFQAIDLRWGVSEQASLDQQTMKICLGEIARCQQITPRPNFIVLLGDRYGWRPLPAEISESEYHQTLSMLANDHDREFVKTWYHLDENACPPIYYLRPRTGKYTNYKIWESEVEQPLRKILEQAAVRAGFTDDQLIKYRASATEQEILRGALTVKDAAEHVFCFFRHIKPPPPLNHQLASDFLDFGEGGKPDLKAINRLKDKLKNHLPDQNIYNYECQWTDQGPSTDHISGMCAQVLSSLSTIIQAEIGKRDEISSLDAEISEQEKFGEQRRQSFTGREKALGVIDTYLRSSSTNLFAIIGEPGYGKSALLAEATVRAIRDYPDAQVIQRFIGATPSSSGVRSLLEGLCIHISRCYGIDESNIPQKYRDLIQYFRHLLGQATRSKPLIIFLDALDQLSDVDNARNLFWLPTKLPDSVHLIVSTINNELFDLLRSKIPAENIFALEPLSVQNAEILLDKWLDKINRQLQPSQRKEVLEKFIRSGNPMYLRLAFEEARFWKSEHHAVNLERDIFAILKSLFKRLSLDANHGPALVNQYLGYIAASKNGLAEDEILDLLSQDHWVMQDLRRRSPESPAVGRLPVVLLSRLYADLEPYLTHKQADGTTTITFYHPNTFGDAVGKVFLKNDQQQSYHQTLAEYFAAQPYQYSKPEGGNQPNLRKLSEMSFQQSYANDWDALQDTLTDFKFLHSKTVAFNTYSLIDDYNLAVKIGYVGNNLAPISEVLRLSADITSSAPDQLAGQLVGRLRGRAEPATQHLIESTFEWGDITWLCPQTASLTTAGGPLQQTLQVHNDWINAVAVTPDGQFLLSACEDKTVKIWDLDRGEELLTLKGHDDEVLDVAITSDGSQIISASSDETIKIWDFYSGSEIRTLFGHENKVLSIALTPDNKRLISASADKTLRIWDLKSGKTVSILRGHRDWIRDVAITNDGKYALSASDDKSLILWDLEQNNLVKTLKGHRHRVYAVAINPDGGNAVSGGGDMVLKIWHLPKGEIAQSLKGHDYSIKSVAIFSDGNRVVSGSDDKTLRVWDLASGSKSRALSGHTHGVSDIAISKKNGFVYSSSGDGTIRIWDPGRKDSIDQVISPHSGSVNAMVCTSNGKRMVTACETGLSMWDINNLQVLDKINTRGTISLAITPDGCRAILGTRDGILKIWDLEENVLVESLTGHGSYINDIAIYAHGKRAISASHDNSLWIWDLDSMQGSNILLGHKRPVTAVKVTQDDKWAISAAEDGTLIVWDLLSASVSHQFSVHPAAIRSLSLFPDQQRIIFGTEDHVLKVLDLETGKLMWQLRGHNSPILDIDISPNGAKIISASGDHTLKLWSSQEATVISTFTGDNSMASCKFCPDNKKIFVGDVVGRVHILKIMS